MQFEWLLRSVKPLSMPLSPSHAILYLIFLAFYSAKIIYRVMSGADGFNDSRSS